jgi:hypothetical protein
MKSPWAWGDATRPTANNITEDDYAQRRFAWKVTIDPENLLLETNKLNNTVIRRFPLPEQSVE